MNTKLIIRFNYPFILSVYDLKRLSSKNNIHKKFAFLVQVFKLLNNLTYLRISLTMMKDLNVI